MTLLHLMAVPLFSQTAKIGKQFVIDADKPFVYLKFDHIGPGAPRNADEPATRIWLRLINNCRVPIVVRANGVPDESPREEVGLEYDVVAKRPVYPIVSFGKYEKPRLPGSTPKVSNNSETEESEVPRGYIEDVASTMSIGPREEILFSMPVNHLSKHWHVEIPFEFDLPRGNGKHLCDPQNGGIPVMIVEYTLWDLPTKSQAEIVTK